ncbi:MAG: cytochrome P450 [Novosphingobium sp.]
MNAPAIDYATADFYTDTALVEDPHAYFHFLRQQGPVTRLPHRNVVAVTGYEEIIELMLDNVHFSPVNAVTGPIPGLPFEPEGDDIEAQVESERKRIPFADQVVTETGERHLNLRSIIATLFTPTRLKELEPKLRASADSLIDEFHASGKVDLPEQYGGPYATLVISDLLGVPKGGRAKFREWLQNTVPAQVGASVEDLSTNPLFKVGKEIFGYLAKRRVANHPLIRPFARLFGLTGEGEILTELALARFPDGSRPTLTDVTGLGAFLFGAGQDTTNRLLANAFRVIATQPEVQTELRAYPERIPDFIEEVLRYDGSVKSAARLCVRTTTLGGVEIKAGTTMLMSHMAANRDPRRFDNPDRFDMNRSRAREHLAFGRGAHTCIGAPLARREVQVSIERLLARMGNIRLSEAHHGPNGQERFEYEPTYILRAMKHLHLEFDPI